MDEATLRQLIAGGETATVEFKSSAARPADIAERMCGMANNRAGGVIIFGIEDATWAIVGIRDPSLTQDHILRAARIIKPPVMLAETSVQRWVLDGQTLVTVEVPANTGRLYQYNGACFVRRGTTTVPLSVEEINTYLNAYGSSRWELALTRNATIDDIDAEAVERYLGYRAQRSRHRRRHSSLDQLLLGLEAAAPDAQTGELRPTNAGMVMFGYDPQLYLPQSEVVCIKYADPLGVRRYIERKNYHGTLPDPEFSEHFDFMVVFRNGESAEASNELNPRQQTGLQLVRDKGSISTSEYVAATGVPARTAYRDLQDLVDRGLLVVRGKRRGARYYLA